VGQRAERINGPYLRIHFSHCDSILPDFSNSDARRVWSIDISSMIE
jgi:hypothetical protein